MLPTIINQGPDVLPTLLFAGNRLLYGETIKVAYSSLEVHVPLPGENRSDPDERKRRKLDSVLE